MNCYRIHLQKKQQHVIATKNIGLGLWYVSAKLRGNCKYQAGATSNWFVFFLVYDYTAFSCGRYDKSCQSKHIIARFGVVEVATKWSYLRADVVFATD